MEGLKSYSGSSWRNEVVISSVVTLWKDWTAFFREDHSIFNLDTVCVALQDSLPWRLHWMSLSEKQLLFFFSVEWWSNTWREGCLSLHQQWGQVIERIYRFVNQSVRAFHDWTIYYLKEQTLTKGLDMKRKHPSMLIVATPCTVCVTGLWHR